MMQGSKPTDLVDQRGNELTLAELREKYDK